VQIPQEQDTEDVEVNWGTRTGISPLWYLMQSIRVAEDQQRINQFSKLNLRLRSIEDKLEELKVRPSMPKVERRS
jgi:hypothetical protein